LILGAVLLLAGSGLLPAAAGASAAPATCQTVQLAVALAPNTAPTAQVVGWFCAPAPLQGRTVQVLISGATYGHRYWDFDYQPEHYSYVQALTAAGYATLNLDRIGIGQSDHPPAVEVTTASNAFVIHQLVQALRDGRLVGVAVPRVVLVGHSLGSGIATVEAAGYHDVDGVILSGFLHSSSLGAMFLPPALYPAQFDPRFSARNLPPGYQTTRPGTRGALFYYQAGADVNVIARDEATKETATDGEITDFPLVALAPTSSLGIQVPVLTVVGAEDGNFCTEPTCPEALKEPLYYTPAAVLEVVVLPEAGHDLNLHLNAPLWFGLVQAWADRHGGPCSAGCGTGAP
jgi:pimeloyl-ACP methyl ester carboxylesterase